MARHACGTACERVSPRQCADGVLLAGFQRIQHASLPFLCDLPVLLPSGAVYRSAANNDTEAADLLMVLRTVFSTVVLRVLASL